MNANEEERKTIKENAKDIEEKKEPESSKIMQRFVALGKKKSTMPEERDNALNVDSAAGRQSSIDLTPLKASDTSLMEVSRNRKNDEATLQYTTNDVGLAKSRTIMPNA